MCSLEFISRILMSLTWLATWATRTESGTPANIIPLHNLATISAAAQVEVGVSVNSELTLRSRPTSIWTTGILAGVSAVGAGLWKVAIPSSVRPPLELVEQRLSSQLVNFRWVAHLFGAWRDSFGRQFNELTLTLSRMAGQPAIDHLPPTAHQTTVFGQRERPLTFYLAEVLKVLFVLATVAGVWKGVTVFERWIATKGGVVIPEAL